ncbi:hypothetical protein Ciccas_011035 [Cichlidogyrus casuarinus]|uniref:Ig-like domain-containing protein n=1 Tax=Cichlidogyrus casuarinus TaxID=1844966 RepID=A0ABD2PX39_9PLAT
MPGTTANLRCEPDSNPASELRWYKALDSDQQFLETADLRHVQQVLSRPTFVGQGFSSYGKHAVSQPLIITHSQDYGLYICVATDPHKRFNPALQRVLVSQAYRPRVIEALSVYAKEGESVRLLCKIDSIPMPDRYQVSWSKDGQPLGAAMCGRRRQRKEVFRAPQTHIIKPLYKPASPVNYLQGQELPLMPGQLQLTPLPTTCMYVPTPSSTMLRETRGSPTHKYRVTEMEATDGTPSFDSGMGSDAPGPRIITANGAEYQVYAATPPIQEFCHSHLQFLVPSSTHAPLSFQELIPLSGPSMNCASSNL